ncbi:MAG: TIGR00730 family Rossman fold protein [Clostridia bacterium]|nr:TIGR00730 family Rossman fold protein [Clostridia bacterium]
MMKKEKIAVFCGSRMGTCPIYQHFAREAGKQIALSGRSLLFGGCDYGLMQAVSHAAHEHGGKVYSFRIRGLTDAFAPEIITADEQMENVQQRKRRLIEAADACIALPGGLGTLDEMGDVYSMAQLGDLRRPLGILNVNGYFDGLLQFVDTMHREGFLSDRDCGLIIVRQDIESLLSALDEL